MLSALTAGTPADALNVIFTGDSSPDGFTVLLYLHADSGAWISTSTNISAIFLMGRAAFIPFNLIDFLTSSDNVSAEWNVYTAPLGAS